MNKILSQNPQETLDRKKAIYILQTINVEQQQYSLFYDTGCCDLFSRHESITSIRKRASR